MTEAGYRVRAMCADSESISTAVRRVPGISASGMRPKKWPMPAAGSRICPPGVKAEAGEGVPNAPDDVGRGVVRVWCGGAGGGVLVVGEECAEVGCGGPE